MTGLLGGGHAIYWDGQRRAGTSTASSTCLREPGRRRSSCTCRSARSSSTTRSGPAPARSRASRAGSARLHARFGRLPWAQARASRRSTRAHRRDRCRRPRRLPRDARAGLHDAGGRRAHLRPRGQAARGRARCSTSPGSCERSSCSPPRARQRVQRLDRRGAALAASRGSPCRGPTSSATSTAGSEPAEVVWAGHRFLTRARARRRPRDALAAAAAPRARRHGPRARAAHRARRRGRRRPHDEPRHRRRRGQRLRPHDEPRSRLGRLPPRPRPAPEQHARRGRPRRRAARARRADGEHDGAEPRPRRRRARPRDRLRRRNAAAHRARRRRRRNPRRGARAGRRRRPCRASTAPATS